jgi:uncharacterized protein YdgA (DUF945 family)
MGSIGGLFDLSMVDPIVLDLGGNGVQLVPLASSNAYFDIHGTGFAVHTGWVGPQTGILVSDPSGGPVTSIGQLFGSASTDGFSALAALDTDHDGVLNANDPGFSTLEVWTDTNGNGVTDPGELQTLAQLGITSINLAPTVVNETVNGNVIGEVATFTRSDGTTGQVAEAYFANTQLDSRFTGTYQLNPETLYLPNLRGYGTVPDLFIAESLDPTLLQLVRNFARDSLADAASFAAQVTAILYRWAGADGVDPASRGPLVNAQQLAVLEKFVGESFVNYQGGPNPVGHEGPQLTSAYDTLFAEVQARLLVQGPLASLFPNVQFNYSTDSLTGTADLASAATQLGVAAPADPRQAAQYWVDLAPFVDTVANDLGIAQSTYESAFESAFAQANLPFTLDDARNGRVLLGSGSETLTGDSGPNVFVGWGGGTDTLIGNGGADLFVFGHGYGQDIVQETDTFNGRISTLQLTSDVSESDVTLYGVGNNLVVTLAGTNDAIMVQGELLGSFNGVAQIKFADGTFWNYQTILGNVTAGTPTFTWVGTAANTTLNGSDFGVNVFDLGPGGDTITAGNSSGGGPGTNTFVFDKGDGQATVNPNGGTGTVQMAADIAASDTILQIDSSGDLIVKLRDTADTLTILNDLKDTYWGIVGQIGTLAFAHGTTWNLFQPTFTWVGTASNTSLVGSDFGSNVFDLGPGGDTVVAGNNSLGASGNNTFVFDKGDGQATVNPNGGTGTVQMAADVAPSDVILQTAGGGDLMVKLLDTGDSLTIQNDLAETHWGVVSQIGTLAFADGTTWNLSQPTFTWIGTPGNTTLAGSNFGSNVFDLGPGGDTVTAGNASLGATGNNTFVFDKGDGQATVNTNGGSGTIQMAADVAPSDVILQADGGGDLTVKLLDTGDSLTILKDLSTHWWGIGGPVSQVAFGNGTTWNLNQPLTFTWIGTAGNTTLTGSNFGSNVFDLGPGGDAVTAGNASLGASGNNTFVFDKGDGQATVNTNGGSGTIQMAADVAPGDVILQADSGGDLTVKLLDTGDSLTILNDLSTHWWGIGGPVSQVAFANGTTWNLNQPLTFTWIGTAGNTALTGSNFGSNVFDLGPGGDAVTAGNNSLGASGNNTFVFDKGDGQATINPNGGTGTVQIAADVAASDMILQTDSNGDLIVKLRDTGDSLTIQNDLRNTYWGIVSQIGTLAFANGATWNLSQPTFTWIGTASNTTLVGNNLGANVFDLGPGGDTITAGNNSLGASGNNTFVFDKGDGQATVNTNGGTGSVQMAADIAASDVILQADSSGDLTIKLLDTGDSLTILKDLSTHWWGIGGPVSQVAFGDGTTWNLNQPLTFTWIGTASNTTLAGSNFGSNVFDLGPGGDIVTAGNASLGASGNNTFVFDKGDGQATINPNGGTGTVKIAADVATSDAILQCDNSGNLTVKLLDTGDSITLQNDLSTHWWGIGGPINQVAFGDGTTWNLNQPLTFTWIGSASNAALVGSNFGSNVFNIGPGAETVTGGNNSLGASGSNTYVFGQGSGQGTINPIGGGGTGLVDFTSGIATNQIWFQQKGSDLQVDLMGTNSEMTIAGWFGSNHAPVQSFNTADGWKLDAQISQLVSAMATFSANNPGFDPTAASQIPNDPNDRTLQSALAAAWHH